MAEGATFRLGLAGHSNVCSRSDDAARSGADGAGSPRTRGVCLLMVMNAAGAAGLIAATGPGSSGETALAGTQCSGVVDHLGDVEPEPGRVRVLSPDGIDG